MAFDPRGLVFAIGLESKSIRLYDPASFDKGPFATFEIEDPERQNVEWTTMKFTNDGDTIMVTTTESVIYLIDGLLPYPCSSSLFGC